MFVLVLAAIYWLSEVEPPQIVSAQDIYVVDGDTIDISGERYRLVGFDTPETYRAECDAEKQRGDLATQRLRQLVASGQTIEITPEGARAKFGRTLGSLTIGGEDVGNILVSENLARVYPRGSREGWC